MDVDQPLAGCSALTTSLVLQTLPKIDENNSLDNKHPKEKVVELLDLLESHVETLRKDAAQLEEDRDQLLATLDTVRHADLLNQLDENDVDDVSRYADRIMNRCQTVEVRVLTQRDKMQEEALSQINHLIDGLVMDLRNDHEAAKQRCISYVNACSSIMVDGVMDKKFESALLGCTLDDQKRVKKRLQGLLSYFERKSTMQNSKYALPAPKVIQKDFNLLQDLRKTFDLPLLEYYPNQPFKQIILTNGSKEYNRIRDKFSSTEKWNKISQIRKIENPFILLHYLIAKSKFLSQNDKLGFEEKFYFHGTGEENLTNICGFNFDRSKIVTHKFGKGISFAKKSSYASYYPYKCTKINKVMVIAKMFYDNPLENGSKTTIIPEGPSCTSKNENGTVLVKYDDASYYPAYIIYYVKKYNKEYDDNDNYYDNGFEDYYDYDDDYEGDFYDKYGVYCEDDFIIDDKPYYKNNYTNKHFKDDDYHDQHYDDKDNKHYYDWYDDFYRDDNYYECEHNIEDYWIENFHYEDCYDYYE